MTYDNTDQHIAVWDWSVRVFHWCLPVLIFLMWFTQDQNRMDWHFLLGEVLLGLLVYRLVWGFIGTPYARFSHFLYGPKTFITYATQLFSREKPRYLSHNPMGGLMVLVLMGAVIFQLVSGLFTTDDIFLSGPLYETVGRATSAWLSRWHRVFFDWLLILIGLHVAAIIFYKLLGEGLLKAMFTGKKKANKQHQDLLSGDVTVRFPWFRFVIAVAIAAAAVYGVFHIGYA